MKINEIIIEQIIPPQIPNTLIGSEVDRALTDRLSSRPSMFQQKPIDPYADLSHMQQYQKGLRSIQDVDPKQQAIQTIVPELDLLGVGGVARSIAKPLASIAKDAAGIYKASKPQPPGQPLPDWTKVEIGSNRPRSWNEIADRLKRDGFTPEEIELMRQERPKFKLDQLRKKEYDHARARKDKTIDKAILRGGITGAADQIYNFSGQPTADSK